MEDSKWLISREIPRLRRYALALVDDPDAADDLVQDCLERAILKRHLWARRGSIRSWLYRILYNVFANQAATRGRIRRQLPIEALPGDDAQTTRQDLRVECAEIADAMQALPADQRAAIVLTAVEELSYEEAAEVLGVPIGTLRSRLFRGREKLRDLSVERTPGVTLRKVE